MRTAEPNYIQRRGRGGGGVERKVNSKEKESHFSGEVMGQK